MHGCLDVAKRERRGKAKRFNPESTIKVTLVWASVEA